MKIKDVMHRGVEWVGPTTSLAQLAERMKRADVGAIPIGENDRLIGMVTDRDIVVRGLAKGGDLARLTARDVMTPGVQWCNEDDDIDAAAQRMREKQIRRLPVLNRAKRMVGMVSLGDLSQAATPHLTAQVAKAVAHHHA